MNDEVNIESLFPTCVSYVNKPQFLSLAKIVFDEYSLNSLKEFELDPFYPVIMTQNMAGDNRISELANYILNTAWNLLKFQGYNMDYFYTQFIDLWGQEHRQGSGMDYHVHGFGAQISGFYFIEVPENSNAIIFHDPRPSKVYADLPQIDDNLHTYASSMVNYKPVEGDLYFHNSWLPHSFSKNKNTQPCRFIHFNIVTIPKYLIDSHNNVNEKKPIIV